MRRVFLKYLIYHDLHSSVGQIVENGIFKMATSRHIGFRAPKNPAHTFTRDTLELSQMTRLYRFSKIPNNVIKQFTLTKTMSILLNYLRVLSVPDSFEHFQRSLVKKPWKIISRNNMASFAVYLVYKSNFRVFLRRNIWIFLTSVAPFTEMD